MNQETEQEFLAAQWETNGEYLRRVTALPTIAEGQDLPTTEIRIYEEDGVYHVNIEDVPVGDFDTQNEALIYANRLSETLAGGMDAVLMNLAADGFRWRTACTMAASFMLENIAAGQYWEEDTTVEQLVEWLDASVNELLNQQFNEAE